MNRPNGEIFGQLKPKAWMREALVSLTIPNVKDGQNIRIKYSHTVFGLIKRTAPFRAISSHQPHSGKK